MKRIDGWEPEEVAEHEYDGDRLIRTVTRREPEWDEEERAWMLAWLTYQANVHRDCGHYLPDTTAPGAEYYSELPIRCQACNARAEAYARTEDQGTTHIQALLFPVKKRR